MGLSDIFKGDHAPGPPQEIKGATPAVGLPEQNYSDELKSYRIAGAWKRYKDESMRPDYHAKIHVYCKYGEFREGDVITCDEEQAEVLLKRFILIPVELEEG